jgi:hypothetical protein
MAMKTARRQSALWNSPIVVTALLSLFLFILAFKRIYAGMQGGPSAQSSATFPGTFPSRI